MPISVQLVIFALIAAVVLFQLYNVLGKRVGRQPEDKKPEPAAAPVPPAGAAGELRREPPLEPHLAEATAQLKTRDPAFDPVKFLDGARQAYVTIVTAYAAGDRETLKPLLSPPVARSFDAGIDARAAAGRSERAEFLHTPRADLDHAEADGDLARVRVRFLAEVRTHVSEGGESRDEERRTAELWTFERKIGASDPNWVLARVEPAQA